MFTNDPPLELMLYIAGREIDFTVARSWFLFVSTSLPFCEFMTAAVASSDLKRRTSFPEKTVPVSSETPLVLSKILPFTFITLKSS